MSPPNPPRSHQPPGARPHATLGQRFDTTHYKPDGGYNRLGLCLTIGVPALVAVVTAWLVSWISQLFYLILIFPFAVGFAIGFVGAMGVKFGKVRHPWIASGAGLLASTLAIFLMHYFDYRDFLKEVNKQDPALLAALQTKGGFGFFSYVNLAATEGVTITRARSSSGKGGWNLGFTGTFIYWFLEWVVVASIAILFLYSAASDPFCTACQEWKDQRSLGRLSVLPGEAVKAFSDGEIARLPRPQAAQPWGMGAKPKI